MEKGTLDTILKKGTYIVTFKDKIGTLLEDYTLPQINQEEEVEETPEEAVEETVEETPEETVEETVEETPEETVEVPDDPAHIFAIKLSDDSEINVNYIRDVRYVVPIYKDEHDTLRQIAVEKLKYLTFRRIDRIIKKTSSYDDEEFYYGFTKSFGLFHVEFLDYPLAYNSSRVFGLPHSLYYQCGDYTDNYFAEGEFELHESNYNHKKPGESNDLMCGHATHSNQGPRYVSWFYSSEAFYKLWLLIMFGEESEDQWYIFRGAKQEEILDMLYDPKSDNPHLYQAYALVIYYNQPIPEEYKLDPGFADDIKNNLLSIIQS